MHEQCSKDDKHRANTHLVKPTHPHVGACRVLGNTGVTEVTPCYFVSDKLSSKATEMAEKRFRAERASVGCFISLTAKTIFVRLAVLCHRGQSCLKLSWSAKNLQSPFLPRLHTPHLICTAVNCYDLVWQVLTTEGLYCWQMEYFLL